MTILISRTELARNTRKVIEEARRAGPVLVESYGEEQVALVDAFDFRLMQAFIRYQASEAQDKVSDNMMGLTEEAVQEAIRLSGSDVQARWDRVVAAHQKHDISFGRAAELLNTDRSWSVLTVWAIPLHIGPVTIEEALEEIRDQPPIRRFSELRD